MRTTIVAAAMSLCVGAAVRASRRTAGGVNPTMLGHLRQGLRAYHAERNATFVVIKHNMEFVMALCTRVLVLAEGRIIAEGSPQTFAPTQP